MAASFRRVRGTSQGESKTYRDSGGSLDSAFILPLNEIMFSSVSLSLECIDA